ncbi:sensor histidine kinase [Tellurirhabdus bombi]|uniref:sensor histidine kinase n=1 Tax=Tellurirhabdus bombi TaxID=2907205 RepID=UPI001F3897EE|nr:HAMP domain-containing sensor histidine kinase [Tellurirhabdus bombi]
MKLLTRTNQIYLSFSLVIYVLTALAFYWIVKMVIYDEVESRLRVEKRDFLAHIQTHNSWSSNDYFVENKIEVAPVSYRVPITEEFTDTLIQDHYDKEFTPFRQLTFYTKIKGIDHRVAIRKSLIQSYRLIEVITIAMVTFLGLLLVGMFWFQGKLSGRLWQPFYETLAKVKRFDLSRGESIDLEKEPIDEFNELNDVLRKMAEKIQQDYRSLKEFTENASHEMQTPLALINARVEQLIQAETLTEKQSQRIDEIYQASRRISRLNQGLLLLAKIENRQFANVEQIDLYALLAEKLTAMDDVLQHKQLRTQLNCSAAFSSHLSPVLADILITNLVNNAIKHNQPDGRIEVYSTLHSLEISNTGPALQTAPDRLFERFKKEATHTDSVGLGLAIVKQICDSYQLTVSYTFDAGMHHVCLKHRPEERAV